MGSPPLLLAVREHLWVWSGSMAPPRSVPLPWSRDPDPTSLTRAWGMLLSGRMSAGGLGGVAADLRLSPSEPVRVGDAVARAVAQALGFKVEEAPTREVASARAHLPAETWRPDRARMLAFADESLRALLSSPAEVVITLSREGDRVERLIRREHEALGALAAGAAPETPVASYAQRSETHLAILEERRKGLDRTLEESTLRLLPNTSAVLGARTAARLLAVTGNPRSLLRLSASQIQIAGAGRRRAGAPGPKHGVLYRAEGMDQVPPDRRGALARSLASWAAVALRADLLTQGAVGEALSKKRAERVRALSAGRRVRRPPRPAPPETAPPSRASPPPSGKRRARPPFPSARPSRRPRREEERDRETPRGRRRGPSRGAPPWRRKRR